MFDILQMFTVGRQFETGDGTKWVAVYAIREQFVIAVKANDPLPAQTYVVEMPKDAAASGEAREEKP